MKSEVTEEYIHSVTDLLVNKGQYIPIFVRQINFGCGDALYGGLAKGGFGPFPEVALVTPFKNARRRRSSITDLVAPSSYEQAE
ncbi:Benzyl alcohol O-benzoyltransferase, partial [Mucuna pruriens]